MTTIQANRTRTDTHTTRTLSEMQQLAQRVEQHHTAGLPDSEIPEKQPFPSAVVTALWLGIVGGGVFGLIVGVMLQNYTLVVPRLEGLYSMTPFTFQFFWLVAGVALGIVAAAVATLLIPPPDYRAERVEHVDVDTTATGNILEVELDDDNG